MSEPVSTNPIPGTRDFFPEEMSVRVQVFETLYRVCESFGYLRYDGPMLEPLELYAAKSSEEIVARQTYRLKDRGDRELVVRPEMTPTVARMIAARGGQLSLPARWYSHPNLWRYERKQRGRYREHWQVNVDVFGVSAPAAETEIFELMAEMMLALGAEPEDFLIRVSDREMMRVVLVQLAGVPNAHIDEVFVTLDALDKVPREETEKRLRESGVATPGLVLEWLERPLEAYRDALMKVGTTAEGYRLIDVVARGLCTSRPVTLRFDPKIFRGFTYYTSTVFELYDVNPQNPRSIAGGGRYDNLTALFGGKHPIPGIGFGMGDVTLIDFLETHGLAPKPRTAAVATVLAPGQPNPPRHIDPVDERRVREIAHELRAAGLRVITPLQPQKIGKVLEKASKEGVRFAVIAGSDEAARGAVKLRDLVRSEEREVPRGQIATAIRAALDG